MMVLVQIDQGTKQKIAVKFRNVIETSIALA
jgi:hypothetical protein